MRRTRHVLTDIDITRQVTLQLPELDFYYTSEPNGPIDREVTQAFCAEYQKIAQTTFLPEGIVRVDFYPSPRRFASWDYEASRQRPYASHTEPICLVARQESERTSCHVQMHGDREAIIIRHLHIGMYGKGVGTPDRQMLPVPTLPATAAQGYVMTYESDTDELVVYLDNGQAIVTE